ncbi:MAG: sterol desaturase family protein [Proteobacteria bacterium]|nr:sterol desaturase family protein [Pseudomonadota bacterium]
MIETFAMEIRLGLSISGTLLFLLLELAGPYRKPSVSKFKRWVVNLVLALFNTVVLNLISRGAIVAAAAYVTANRVGLLNLIEPPSWFKTLATLVFMDFMLYVWHLLNHEAPLLWRFHRVHHSDLNMDVSTAARFHLGELMISAVIKIALVYFIGAALTGVVVFESLLLLCAQFHHSSLRVPAWFERVFWVLFVPPSMHRIHHSVVIRERNANYGTVFSLWDRIMGTMRADVDQTGIRIGLGAYPRAERLNLHHLLTMPFTRAVR